MIPNASGKGLAAAFLVCVLLTPSCGRAAEGVADELRRIADRIESGGAGAGAASPERYRHPAVALLMSAVMPGAGQHYNGQVWKGLAVEACVVGGWIALGASHREVYSREWKDGTVHRSEHAYRRDEVMAGIGFGVAALAYGWSLLDAPLHAAKMNRSRALAVGSAVTGDLLAARLHFRF